MAARNPVRSGKPPPSRRTAAPRKAATRPSTVARTAAPGKPEVRIFVSYSHVDADERARFETHLAPLRRDNVTTWFDGDLNAGDALDANIARELKKAHVFVALLSPSYLNSHYCWQIEYKRATGRRRKGTMRVVAAVDKPCDWKATDAAGFKLLPKDGKPVINWRSADLAFLDIAQGIRGVVKDVRKHMAVDPQPPSAAKAPAVAPRTKPPAKPKPGKVANARTRTGAATKRTAKPASSRPKVTRSRP
ncbi:TIR domain-containing protein [Methylobacterium sp. UNCCL125]|nr:TIR domain-containing protein [Methylobacterium sp. UNCCL125]